MSIRTVLALGMLVVAGCASGQTRAPTEQLSNNAPADAHFSAEIRRTAYGVPHIKADDFGGIGYGFGYASAQDNICEILDRMMTVTASRARFLGPGENDANVLSDYYHQRVIDAGEAEALLAGPVGSPDTPSADARALASGYVAGVNRFIRDTGAANISDPRCKGAPWVREIREIDFWRHMLVGQTVDSYFAPVTTAAPPGRVEGDAQRAADPFEDEVGLGSNAYGLGRDVTKSGHGMVLGNPHYPWTGPNRFYRTHFIIPGKLNVVGVSYIGMPLIRMGHTANIAWSNTVSTARRYGYFELTLDPSDPTRYMYEGVSTPMSRATVSIDVLRNGVIERESRVLFSTRWGPVVSSKTYPWTREKAFSLRTPRVGLRDLDQYMGVWQAADVRALQKVLGKYQAYRFNTTAADAGGEALYGDLGMVPNVTPKLAEACSISDFAKQQWRESRIPVLDGSRAACDWLTDADASAPGAFGPANSPHLFRTDYVTQSNDSYWLTNPAAPMTGYSPIWGDEATKRSLRTRLGLEQVAARVAGTDGLGGPKFDLRSLQNIMYGNRHLGAELVRDDLVRACRASGKAKLQPACDVLAKWDLKVDLDSRGAHLFHLFAEAGGLQFKVPFDPANPVHTPNTLDTSDARVLAALESAVNQLESLNIPLDARLRDVQVETRGDERIPIHGGAGPEGVFNVVTVTNLTPVLGWTNIRHGASWIMTVEFTDHGPVSEGILTYSESTDSTSAHWSDQTRLYSKKGWDDLRFTDAAVEAGTTSRLVLSQ
jgi:acyl-homoserine-lactone acylase